MLTSKGVFEETQLPAWEAEAPLVHIGSLNPSDKGMRGDSYEGHGLSVSDCPDAWEAIAKLGGNPWWHLEKSEGVPRFLDWHSVQDSARAKMVAWAVDSGFAVPSIGFRLSWYDDDRGGRVFSTFDDPHSARIEYDSMVLEFEGDEADEPTLEEVEGHVLTPVGLQALARKRADFGEVPELSAILYCESETELDGVYWGDVLDEEGLSAPRAVIFPHRLAGFHVTPYVINSELMDPRTVEYTETVEARLAALPRLQQQAGAAYTLHQVASKALQVAAGDANAVNWDQVHKHVYAKAVRQDKQPAAKVLEAIKRHSPGAVTPVQIAAVQAMGVTKKMPRMDPQSIKRAIHALAGAQADEFHVVCQNTLQLQSQLRPILLIVHPGDAIERACDWNDRAIGEKVASLAMSNQAGMADEILAKLPTHDAIVLHRISSMYLDKSDVQSKYRDAVDQCEAAGLVLYGDDLETAAKWMLDNVPGLKVEGVPLFMTGAYADAEYGCITAVGKALLEVNPELRVVVSEHAPTDNGDSLPRWRPKLSERQVLLTQALGALTTVDAGAMKVNHSDPSYP